MSKLKEIVMLLLSASTDQDLQEMLQEDWNCGIRQCVKEELQRREAGARYDQCD